MAIFEGIGGERSVDSSKKHLFHTGSDVHKGLPIKTWEEPPVSHVSHDSDAQAQCTPYTGRANKRQSSESQQGSGQGECVIQ